ncbi:MAG: sensor histidine kinase, partial [Thermodesulfobacteriota bacterium]
MDNARPLLSSGSSVRSPHDNAAHYFSRLRARLLAAMLLAFLTPLVLLSVYFHLQFNLTLKQSGKQQLVLLAESQRNTIDLFLQERAINVLNLFHGQSFSAAPAQADMNMLLKSLQETSDAFIDVGFLDDAGRQIGYAGPYGFLHMKDYSKELWFKTLSSQSSDYYISDIYLGFRNKPHFTIAVKQRKGTKTYIMRATLDPDKFYHFLRAIGQGKQTNSFIINRDGRYQVVDPGYANVLDKSRFQPSVMEGSDVLEIKEAGQAELAAYAWLREAPWVLVVKQPLKIAYSRMYSVRGYIITGTAAIALLLFAAVVVTTNVLIRKAERTEKDREELKSQLFHASKLASVGELAAGVAHEINNPLAIIGSQCVVIRDLFDPEFGGQPPFGQETIDQMIKELAIIEEAVFRTKDITHKLLSSARKTDPKLAPCDVNRLLDEVVDGFMERECHVANIDIVKEYAPRLPQI